MMFNKEQELEQQKVVKTKSVLKSGPPQSREEDSAAASPYSNYKLGEREVRGAVTLDSGAVYEGEWLNGLRDGSGK